MLSTLPITHVRTQIYLVGNPFVKKHDTTPNQMVERESFLRKVRKLRGDTELLQKPVYEVRGQAKGKNENLAEDGQRPITCIRGINHNVNNPSEINQLRNPKFSTAGYVNSASQEYSAPVLAEQLPLFLERELVSLFDDTRLRKAERVLEYLAQAEPKELDPWAQDDIRVAWMTVLYAARGFQQPWEYAFWCYYGKHPSKAIPIWLERWAERERLLGPGPTEGQLIYPKKKPVQSVRDIPDKKAKENL